MCCVAPVVSYSWIMLTTIHHIWLKPLDRRVVLVANYIIEHETLLHAMYGHIIWKTESLKRVMMDAF